MKKPTLEQLKRVQNINHYYYQYKNQKCAWKDCKELPNLYYILIEEEIYSILVFCNCKYHIKEYTKNYIKERLTGETISPVQKFTSKELFTIQIL